MSARSFDSATTTTPADGPMFVEIDGVRLIECCIVRKARKRWPCRGDGAGRSVRRWACDGSDIEPGDVYIEHVGEVAAYQSGTRHCMACARAFLADTRERTS